MMEFRNPAYNAHGTIDCEINHPSLGWIPFTADPADDNPLGPEIHAAALLANPAAYVAPTRVLADVKTQAKAEINQLAGEARARFITVIPGQEMLYLEKKAEAKRWLEAQNPSLQDYPLLAAEVNITAIDAPALANLWMQMAAQWSVVAATIEAMRMAYINNVTGAANVATVDAMMETYRPMIAAVHP